MAEEKRDRFRTPSGTLYDPSPNWKKHGYDFAQIKLWRQQQLNAGKPSELDDFYHAHGICLDCRGAGRSITGLRWRDADYWPHSVPLVEGGPHTIESLLANEVKDAVAWDWSYKTCEVCRGTGMRRESSSAPPSGDVEEQ